jgi:hypothetical protein
MTALPDGTRIRRVEDHGNRLMVIQPPHRTDCIPEPPAPVERQGDVQWYVPYTNVHPATVEAAPADAVWVDVSTSTDAYFAALYDIWAAGDTFALLEHDVVCRPDVIRELEECPEPWCLYGYADICHRECMDAWRNALGCTRFRAELIQAVPDAVASIPAGWREWTNLCDRLGERLRAAGFTHHFHEPWVGHRRMMGLSAN